MFVNAMQKFLIENECLIDSTNSAIDLTSFKLFEYFIAI
jgi:hypothetical protein